MCAAYKMHHTSSISYAALSSAGLCERVWQALCHARHAVASADHAVRAQLQPRNTTCRTDCSRVLYLINGSCMLAGFRRTSFHGLFLAVYQHATNPACWRSLAWHGICVFIQHPTAVIIRLHSAGAIWALYYATSGTAKTADSFDQVLCHAEQDFQVRIVLHLLSVK